MIAIKNISKGCTEGVYIGRFMTGWHQSWLANPFHITGVSPRQEVIASYRTWLRDKVALKDKRVIEELTRLRELAKAGDLTLLCWCAPKRCHGEVIKEAIETWEF